MKSTIGQIVKTETELFDKAIQQWQRPFTDLVNVIKEYKSLPDLVGPFTNDTYLDIAHSKGKKTFAAFTTAIKIDTIKRIGEVATTLLLNANVENLFKPLKEAIEIFNNSMQPQFNSPQLQPEDIEIVKEKPVLQKDKILKPYQYTLDNEKQVAIYDKILSVQTLYNEANALLLTFAAPSDIPMLHDKYGLFSEDSNGFLTINFGHINRIK